MGRVQAYVVRVPRFMAYTISLLMIEFVLCRWQEHTDELPYAPVRDWYPREYVPLEHGPLRVQIVRKCCCDKDVAQHAQAVRSTYKTQHLP